MTRPMPLALAVTALVAALSSVSPLSHAVSHQERPAASPARGSQIDGAFGYWVGEERRYVLGPPEALTRGVMANWLVRLESSSGEGEDRRATFAFAHVREMGSQGRIDPEAGEIQGVTVEGTAVLNRYGFPLELSFTLQERYYGYGEVTYSLRYVYEDERYLKEVWFEGKKADYPVPVPGYDGIEKSLPAGVFLFMPDRTHCGPWESEFPIGRPDPRRQPEYRDDCGDADIAFANPGFLDIALPALWEAGGEGSFLCLTPTGPEVLPGGGSSLGFSNRQGTARSGLGGKPDWSKARDLQRHYQGMVLAVGEPARIAVGRRRMEATRIYLSSSTISAAYVDRDRKVVRLDLNPEFFGVAGDGARMWFSGPELWIRILFASEY